MSLYSGQDLMLAAFKKFHAAHPDALLMHEWFSKEPLDPTWGVHTICESPLVKRCPPVDLKVRGSCVRFMDGDQYYEQWLTDFNGSVANGIALIDSFEMSHRYNDKYLLNALKRADAAVFPFQVARPGTSSVSYQYIYIYTHRCTVIILM